MGAGRGVFFVLRQAIKMSLPQGSIKLMAKKGKDFKMPDPLFSAEFLRDLAEKAKNEYKKITFDKSSPKMADGKPFPPYSTKGSDVGFRTINGKKVFIDSYANRKKSGKIPRSRGEYANSTAPVLTGDLALDTTAGHSVSKSAIYIGWTSHANKIDWLRDMKPTRILTSKSHPINPKILDKIMPEFNKEYKRIMPKGTHTITIGKKK